MRNAEKAKLDNAVLETLNLLEDLPQEKVRAGFYDRLNYRIEHLNNEQHVLQVPIFTRIIRLAATPALAAACIAFGIFIGLGTEKSTSSTDLDLLVNTYNLGVSETTQLFDMESD
jgi:hypothetical protein